MALHPSRMPDKPVLTIPEVAAWLGWSERRCYREAKRWLDSGGAEGIIPCKRSGRKLYVASRDLRDVLGVPA